MKNALRSGGFDGDAYISSLNMFGIRLGLDNVKKLFSAAGDPQKKLRFIHIAGTNGKGSTGAMLECALRGAGLRTGFYSSPHLIDIKERFRIDGRAVGKKRFDDAVRELAEKSEGLPTTYFEFTTVLAAVLFKEENCDIVIWETGMGGRLDATNAVLPAATVITNIALDHQKHLGSTLAAIAGEKAGILKPGVPLFHGEIVPEAKEVIYARARELGAAVTGPEDGVPPCLECRESPCGFTQTFLWRGKKIELGIPGRMQRENFRIVFNVLEYLAEKLHFDFGRALASLDHVRWPARLDKIEERVFVDGGHNPDGIRALTESLRELLPDEKFTVVYGAFKDKDASGCLPLYRGIAEEFIMIPNAEAGRACHRPEELAAAARALGFAARTAASGREAVELALASSSRRVLVSGSLFLAGEVLSARGKLDRALDLRQERPDDDPR